MSSLARTTSYTSVNSDYGEVIEKIKELLRPEDRIIQTVRLEGGHFERQRFLSIVCNQKADEYCLLGIDCSFSVKQQNLNTQKDDNASIEDEEVSKLHTHRNFYNQRFNFKFISPSKSRLLT